MKESARILTEREKRKTLLLFVCSKRENGSVIKIFGKY